MSTQVERVEVVLTPAQIRRRRRLSIVWAVLVVGWSLVRAVVVWAALSDYGVDPWAYLVVDLACAATDAVTTPKFVLSLIDSKYHEATRWGIVTVVAFVIPDIYIFKTTHELPRAVVTIICIVIVASLSVAVVGVITKVRAGKAGHPDRAALPDLGPHD